jgi:Flp pilus assembly protein TadD
MSKNRVGCILMVTLGIISAASVLRAGDLRLPLPGHSQLTPVQKLNREGVDLVRKHQYRKAETVFYKAYLFDPDDPFTLNNLGYISELEGQVERARKFYALASEQAVGAVIDQSSVPHLKGKPVVEAISSVQDASMRINEANVESIYLLSQGRTTEADTLLQRTLALDSRNPFTLNNLGLAKEMQGDFDGALRYYSSAADLKSKQPVVVTLNSRWRNKPVSDMAADSAKKILERLRRHDDAQTRASVLNLRGVAAINRNDWSTALEDFRQAYTLNPYDAFSLNNAGFLAEVNGDPETAQTFYEKAQTADGSSRHVGVATDRSAEGKRLASVAQDNDQKMDYKFEAQRRAKQREKGPIQLKNRDNTPVTEPTEPVQNPAPESPALGPPQPPIPQLDQQPPTTPPQTQPDPSNPPH